MYPLYFNSRPHEEVDDTHEMGAVIDMIISTHDLTRRSTHFGYLTYITFPISTHDLTRRSTRCCLFQTSIYSHFNSRPHEEVDLKAEVDGVDIDISTHDLTRRSTGCSHEICPTGIISTHDLTRRSTDLGDEIAERMSISTHDLTRRSTADVFISLTHFKISTHDLTRRSTFHIVFDTPISIFQLTTSRGGRLQKQQEEKEERNFNSRPHEEVDVWPGSRLSRRISISTHDLTRRSTRRIILVRRRGHFNSRPHEEVDLQDFGGKILEENFNSRPHEEVDNPEMILGTLEEHFNSRPHEEVDGYGSVCDPSDWKISTHDLTRRSTAIFTQKVFLSKSLFVLIAYNIFILH